MNIKSVPDFSQLKTTPNIVIEDLQFGCHKRHLSLCLIIYIALAIYVSEGVLSPDAVIEKFRSGSLLNNPQTLFWLSSFLVTWFVGAVLFMVITLEKSLVLSIENKTINVSRLLLKDKQFQIEPTDLLRLYEHPKKACIFEIALKSNDSNQVKYESKNFYWKLSDYERNALILKVLKEQGVIIQSE